MPVSIICNTKKKTKLNKYNHSHHIYILHQTLAGHSLSTPVLDGVDVGASSENMTVAQIKDVVMNQNAW